MAAPLSLQSQLHEPQTPPRNLPSGHSTDPAREELSGVVNKPTVSSTPAKAHIDSGSRADERGAALMADLMASGKILTETPTPDGNSTMIQEFVSQVSKYDDLAAELLTTEELDTFHQSCGSKMPNEEEFKQLLSKITLKLGTEITSMRFVHQRFRLIQARKPLDSHNLGNKSFGLKPDFFSSRVEYNTSINDYSPVSVSSVLHPPRDSTTLAASYRTPDPINIPTVFDNSSLMFTWEDIHSIWEIKSGGNSGKVYNCWENLILKATEVLRYQSHRDFVHGFLICGHQLRMFRIERSYVLVSLPVSIGNNTGGNPIILVKCILAELVLQDTQRGFLKNHSSYETVQIDGIRRLMVHVGGKPFVLGDQISAPAQDHLSSRATTVHLACTPGDNQWNYCFKSNWPYANRPHEGEVLHQLRNVPGVVRVIAWDTPTRMDNHDMEVIAKNYQVFRLSRRYNEPRTPISGASTPMIDGYATPSSTAWSPVTPQLHIRECRQTVVPYIPLSFDTLTQPIQLLQGVLSLFNAVSGVLAEGWVHRDLSWTNIRVKIDQGVPSITLIDFDLAAPIEGPSTGSPDKTGTPAFMPLESLMETEFRHQELHEDEAMFWVFFLTAVRSTNWGQGILSDLLRPLPLIDIGYRKLGLLLKSKRQTLWPKLFCGEWAILGRIFEATVSNLFTFEFEYNYSTMGLSRTAHVQKHREFLEKSISLCSAAINKMEADSSTTELICS